MKQKITPPYLILLLGGILCWAITARAQTIGQWDFNSSNLVQSAGSTVGDLQFADGSGGATELQTVFGTTTSLGIPDIGGTPAIVMKFAALTNGQGYFMPALLTPNGGGSEINSWSLILDLLYPSGSDLQMRPIIDIDGATTTGGGFVAGPDFAVGATDGIGAPPGPFFGSVKRNTWYRIGMVVTTNLVSFYVNGVRVGTINGAGLDGRFALSTTSLYLILSTILDQAAPGYVNSIQIRDVALSPGQMQALGGPSAVGIPQTIPPVPAFIDTSSPAAGATGVAPTPSISVVLNQGDTTVNASSIKLLFDGALLPSSVAATPPTFLVTAAITNLLDPSSVHTLSLVWQDSVNGTTTNSWSFTVTAYQSVSLPAPFYLENFDELAEGTLPAGWVATNATTPEASGFDLCNPNSDSYLNWVVINTNRLCNGGPCSGFECDTLNQPVVAIDGALIDSLAHSNILFFESDNRCNNCFGQVGVLFTADIDCTGRTNVFVSWHSLYTQNQDNIGALEYSIDQGTNWLPVIYYLDDQNQTADVIRTNGVIDIGATFLTPRGDQPAGGTNYGFFIAAPITTSLIPYVAGRINDDQVSGKRIEIVRLAQADGQAHVRFRFVYAGTCSWYWGIDEFGLYEVNTPVITTQPQSQTIDAGTPVTFSVVATSAKPLTYQWQFNGNNIAGATDSSYTIASVSPGDAGQYKVIVRNSDGPTPSAPATLTVVTTPQVLTQPYDQVAYVNSSVTFNTSVRGGQPLTLQWLKDGTPVPGGTSANLTLNGLKLTDAGNYMLTLSNAFGTNATISAHLTVVSGPITNGLVTHLKFDGDYSDASGNGVNGSAVGTPTFQAGILGQAVHIISTGSPADAPDTNNYVTLGTASQLQFGTNDFSFSFWAKLFSQNDDKPYISNKDWGSGGNLGWVLATEGGGMKWNLRDNISSRRDSATVAPQLRDGNWHNIVVTFIRSSVGTIYVDGQVANIANVAPDAGKAIGSADTTMPVNIGQDGTGHYTDGSGGAAIDMLVDDVGIWNRALAPTEAASIFVQGQQGQDLTTASGAPVVLPATITADPFSEVVSAGGDASFSVTAGGTPPFTFSWLKNGAPFGTANSSNLTILAVTANDAGAYAAVVSNAGGSATSHVAQLVVFSGSITQDLVAHLKFNADYKDSSGNGTDGSAVGTPSFQPGVIGQAVHVNSAGTPANNPSPNNYVSLGKPTQLNFGSNDFSISFWAKITSQNDDKPFISNKDWNSGSNPGWAVATEGNGMKWNFKDDQSSRRDSPHVAPQLEDGNWHNVVVSFFRASSGRTYVDGQLVNTANLAPDAGKPVGSADTTNSVNIGQDGTGLYTDDTSGAAVDMLVDDLGIWRRVVTPQEALAIFNAGQAGKDLSQVGQGAPANFLTATSSNGTITLSWTGTAGRKLQKTLSLSQPNWTDVPGTSGTSTYSESETNSAAFYRLSGP